MQQRHRAIDKRAPLLRIPAQQRRHVDRLVPEIENLRINRRVRQSAQPRQRAHPPGVAPQVALRHVKRRVVIAVARRSQLFAPVRINFQIVEPSFRAEQRIARQNLRRIESDRVLQQRRIERRRRRDRNFPQPRLLDRVPIFQRRFRIAIEKIKRAEKFQRVLIFRIDLQRRAQFALRRARIFQFVIDACQLDEKSRLLRRLAMPCCKNAARDSCQRCNFASASPATKSKSAD